MRHISAPHYTVLALLSLLLSTSCDTQPPEQRTQSAFGGANSGTGVITYNVELRPMVDEIQALGTARANESVEIISRVSSLVTKIAFEEGQLLQQGELLIELENSEIRAGLAVAIAALSESRSIYNRSKSLISTQAISASSLDELQAAMRVDEANVEAARARLNNTSIRAPFAGRVGLRRISPGSFVDNSTVITTLDDTSTIKLDFSIPEMFLPVVTIGMQIVARSAVYPDRLFSGKVASIDTRLDPVARAVQIRALLPNPDDLLKPGMFLTVDLQRDRGDVLAVPEEAIVPERGQQYVYLAKEGTAVKREVTIGRRSPGWVVILTGIVEGDTLIIEGTHKLRDGSQIEVLGRRDADTDARLNPATQ